MLSSLIIGKPFLIANCILWEIICKYWFIGIEVKISVLLCIHCTEFQTPLKGTVSVISRDPPGKDDNV